MEEIQLTSLQKNISGIINSVIRSHRSVIIRDKERSLVKISPIASPEQGSWLGCMKGKGKIKGDIVSPAEDAQSWQVLSE
uniref:type II toxin-antitoxin system Phd/YefM family antitoxin n=1 Tax=Candidatus Electronema sp. TaxID=2698783 RepID=UPI004056D847